jgi:hypothetical protein
MCYAGGEDTGQGLRGVGGGAEDEKLEHKRKKEAKRNRQQWGKRRTCEGKASKVPAQSPKKPMLAMYISIYLYIHIHTYIHTYIYIIRGITHMRASPNLGVVV